MSFVHLLGLKSQRYEQSLIADELNSFYAVVQGNMLADSEKRSVNHQKKSHLMMDSDSAFERVGTYLSRLRQGEFELLTTMGIELKQVLHGEQEYEYHKPIRLDDVLSFETLLHSVSSKKTKAFWLHICTLETLYYRKTTQELLASSMTTFIIRVPIAESHSSEVLQS